MILMRVGPLVVMMILMVISNSMKVTWMMNRSQQNRLSILKVESKLCPKVCKRLHRERMVSNRWLACWAFDTRFKVKNGLVSFIIELSKRTCSCRK